jgi:hypothetical protein
MQKNYDYTSRTGFVMPRDVKSCWRYIMMVFAFFLLAGTAFGQSDFNPPDPSTNCVSQDMVVTSATLGEPCVACGTGEDLRETLELVVVNKTNSTRRAFAYWATVRIVSPSGVVTTQDIQGCQEGPWEGGKPRTVVEDDPITFECGSTITLTNVFLAWTDASDSERNTCDYLLANPNSINPKCGKPGVIPVNTPPAAPIAGNNERCGTGTVTLSASGCTNGTLTWYAAASGGTPLGTGSTFTTPVISTTTIYYVACVLPPSAGSCVSTRTPVTATVNPIPGAPTAGTTPPQCGPGAVTLTASGCTNGTLNWYAAASGGTSLGTGGSFTTPSLSSTTTYYVSCTIGGCESARTPVTATINPIPSAPVAGPPASNCGPGSLTLSVTGCTGGTINWYAAATGGASLGTGASYTTPSLSTSTTYYASCTLNGCTSARTAVTANISNVPDAPIAVPNSRCGPGSVTISATGCSNGTLTWYAAASGGTALGTGASYTTASISANTTYYVSCTIGDCVSARTPVTASVYPEATVITGGPYEVPCAINGGARQVTLNPTYGGGATSVTWSVPAGMGTVVNNVYTPSATALAAGTPVILTAITNDPIGPCLAASADVTVTFAICRAFEGCTLGYWKNHTDRWCSSYQPGMIYGDIFTSAPDELEDLTLLQALNLGGGGIYNLARQSVAALLNICSSEVNYNSAYPYTSSLISAVNAAFDSGSKSRIANLGTTLDIYNNAGCPLGGSPATTSATSSSSSSLYSNENSLRLHPNPFSDKTTIEFTSEQGGTYELVLYDMSGRLVKKVSSGLAEAGKPYSITIRSAMLKEGMYLARLRVGNVTRSVKVILKR